MLMKITGFVKSSRRPADKQHMAVRHKTATFLEEKKKIVSIGYALASWFS